MANNSQQQTAAATSGNRPAPVPGRPLPTPEAAGTATKQPAPLSGLVASPAMPTTPATPAKGAVLLHVHTSEDIATHVVENATVMKLRSQFGKGPGFEKFLLTKLRNLLVSA